MTAKRLRILELVLVLSIAFLPSLVQSIYFQLTGVLRDYTADNNGTHVAWIFQSILSIVLMFYILFRNNKSYKHIGLRFNITWNDILVSIGLLLAAGIARTILTGLVSVPFPDFFKQASNPQNLGFIRTGSFGFLLLIMIIVPIQEELIVRGFAMTEIFQLSESKSLAIIISVLIQFSYHLYQGIAPAILMLPIFIVFSIYFIKTGNLNPVVLCHVFTDIIALAMQK